MKGHRTPFIAVTALVLAALSACSMAPVYQRPEVAQPAAFQEIPPGWQAAQPADDQARGDWWRRFGDDTLNTLQARVTVSNQNLKAALARYDQARALADIARAPSLPLLNATVSATRARASQNSAKAPAGSPLSSDHSLGLNLSYELDLWGRVRNAAQSGDARVQASAADLEALRLSLQAELASNYFALRGQERMAQLLGHVLDAYEQALALTQRRFDGGLVTGLDVDQARLQLENTRTTLADVQLKRAQLVHAIAVLVGEPAPGFGVPGGDFPKAALDARIQAGLPSSLLERRPDVAAAERRVFAANADIGVARAAYYPTFSIGGTLGLQSAASSNWFEAPSRFWSVGPQALLNLFDGGRTDANIRVSRAAFDEAAANYRQTVLTAYREAEDSLAAVRQLDLESISQQAAEAAATRALAQSRRQYDSGLVTYLSVVTAQTALLQASQAGVNIEVARLNARVQLIKALGGDWHAPPPDTQARH
ncbi:efflux transporter outer membrane subunit [Aquabacterium sp.]|uniref:efflux transporter outer membrane subunit n=1 Tax=Aquabacterium sp. TaxID=1872578 RepID=UPI003D6D4BA5